MPFASLGLDASVLKAIADQGYTDPTPIQKASIPTIIEGQDVIGVAQTGTGKTAAFTLPLLTKLVRTKSGAHQGKVRCLILAPTRELAVQITDNISGINERVIGISVANSTSTTSGLLTAPQYNRPTGPNSTANHPSRPKPRPGPPSHGHKPARHR